MTQTTPDPTAPEMHLGIKVKKSVKLNPIMRMTAQHMLASHSTSAPVTVFGEASANNLIAAHKRFAGRADAPKVTFTHLLLRLVCRTLVAHPQLNACLAEDTLKLFDEINIGMATALPDGNLIVPVIRAIDKMSVDEIALKAAELAARARAGKIRPEDVRNGTFTLTNVGMFTAVRWSTPLLNMPQTGILGIGAIQQRGVIRDGALEQQSLVGLSLTFDHRVVNGYQACQFVQTLADMIAAPDQHLGDPA